MNWRVGIPWAPADPTTGDITCPVCGLVIAEAYDDDGERETNRYGEHYAREHLYGPCPSCGVNHYGPCDDPC